MSVLIIPDLAATGDDALQDLIEREEAWLARRIGALVGERTETFHVRNVDDDEPLMLRRSTDAVEVEDAGTEVAVRLLANGSAIEPVTGTWVGPVAVTYTPNDEDEVRRALVELVALAQASSPYRSETIGDYSYDRGGESGATPVQSTQAAREAIVRDLLPRRRLGTIRLRSGMLPDRVAQAST